MEHGGGGIITSLHAVCQCLVDGLYSFRVSEVEKWTLTLKVCVFGAWGIWCVNLGRGIEEILPLWWCWVQAFGEEQAEVSRRTEVMQASVQLEVALLMPFSVLSQAQSSPFGIHVWLESINIKAGFPTMASVPCWHWARSYQGWQQKLPQGSLRKAASLLETSCLLVCCTWKLPFPKEQKKPGKYCFPFEGGTLLRGIELPTWHGAMCCSLTSFTHTHTGCWKLPSQRSWAGRAGFVWLLGSGHESKA